MFSSLNLLGLSCGMFNPYFFIFLGSHFCLLLVLKVGGGMLCEFRAINIGPSLVYFHLSF